MDESYCDCAKKDITDLFGIWPVPLYIVIDYPPCTIYNNNLINDSYGVAVDPLYASKNPGMELDWA